MTPQELKSSILQLAIQGRLVEQRPEEGTGEELYRQIQAEKKRLIQAGKIKQEKPLPEIAADEVPFEIPESWKWVRIRDYCTDIFSGKAPVYTKQETEYRIIGQAANQQNGLDLSQVKYTTKEFWSDMDSRYFLKKDDVLLNTLGNGTLGRTGIVTNLQYPLLTDGHLFVFRLDGETQSKYLYYYFQLRREEIEKAANGTTNQVFLTFGKAVQWLVPLPPLAEQKRIVAKIEELLPYLSRYEKAWNRLEDFGSRFPADMQKSILQMAIQGKLVEQRPEEGTGEELYRQIQAEKQALIKAGKIKKEKPLPEIAEDEVPFEIPEGWKWVRLQNMSEQIVDCPHSTPRYYDTDTGYYVIGTKCMGAQGDITRLFCTDEETYIRRIDRLVPQENDIVYSREGSIVCRAVILPKDKKICLGQRVMLIRPGTHILQRYLQLFLMCNHTVKHLTQNYKGVGVKHINVADVCSLPIPLPPLAEQKRIVARLEEILPLCERLK